MPLAGRAQSGRVTIRGGRKLARFLENAAGLTDEVLARAMAKVLKQRMVPALRTLAPNRTGRLRRSLRIVQRGGTIELRAVFYGRFVPFGGQTLAEAAIDWINRNKPTIRAQLRLEVRRELQL